MSFRFRMYLADGEDLDDYTSSEPNWSPGDVVYARGRPAYRITAVIPADSLNDELYQGIWASRDAVVVGWVGGPTVTCADDHFSRR